MPADDDIGELASRALGPSPTFDDQLRFEECLKNIERNAYRALILPYKDGGRSVLVKPRWRASAKEVARILSENGTRLRARLDRASRQASWALSINKKNLAWLGGERYDDTDAPVGPYPFGEELPWPSPWWRFRK